MTNPFDKFDYSLSQQAKARVTNRVSDVAQSGAHAIDDAVRRAANAATFNAADYVAGAFTPSSSIDEEREKTRQAKINSPLASAIGDLAGTMLNPATRFAAGKLPAGNSFANYAGQGALYGGTAGGTLTEGGPQERAMGALTDATLGAAAGVAIPEAAQLAGTVLRVGSRPLREALSKDKGVERAWLNYIVPRPLREALLKDKYGLAIDRIGNAADNDMANPARLQRRLNQLGPTATLADAGGPNMAARAEIVAQSPGAQAGMAQRVLETRASHQPTRVLDSVEEAFGNVPFHKAEAAIIEGRAKAASKNYPKIYAQPVRGDLKLQRFLQDDKVQGGIKKALANDKRIALANDEPFDIADYGIKGFDEHGRVILEQGGTNLRFWDMAKRGLDDELETYRNGVTKQLVFNDDARAVDILRAAMVKELDIAAPSYKAVRAAYAGPSKMLDAMHKGRAFMNNDPEITELIIKEMGESEREMFLVGVARDIRDKIDRVGDDLDVARKIFGSPEKRKKLKAAFPDGKTYRIFANKMVSEMHLHKRMKQILGNSRTAFRQASQDEDGADIMNAVSSGLMSGAGSGAVSAGRAITRRLASPNAGVRLEEGRILLSQDPLVQKAAMQEMTKRKAAGQSNEEIARALLRFTAQGAGATSGVLNQ